MWISYSLMILVALFHIWFMVLESFLWTRESTAKSFGMTREYAQTTAVLAANQGVYNLFLSAGLFFALWHREADLFRAIASFFLICVFAAGVVGALTASRKILFVQALPAALALGTLWSGL
jgi:putative membrane protein